MKRFFWGLMAFLSVAVAFYAFALTTQTETIRGNEVLAEDLAMRAFALYGHLIGGGIALLVGSFQFLKGVRKRWPRAHRWTGRIYVAACVTSALCGLVMAVNIEMGSVARYGFSLLALAWLVTTVPAYMKARARDFRAHEIWMIRSFAVTLAAVSLRFQLPVMMINEVPFPTAYDIVSFSCWVPNLVLAELFLKLRGRKAAPMPA